MQAAPTHLGFAPEHIAGGPHIHWPFTQATPAQPGCAPEQIGGGGGVGGGGVGGVGGGTPQPEGVR